LRESDGVGLCVAGGPVQKPVNSCYAMTTTSGDMANQMRASGETALDNGGGGVGASMDTARLVSSFTVPPRAAP